MSALASLKTANSLSDVATILGFKPRSLSYLLYKKEHSQRYFEFEILKKNGQPRKISAPASDLKNLQKRLSEILQNCIEDINEAREVDTSISHGFRRKHSIFTHAKLHQSRRFVFNIDLEDFFGQINFGRVRGYFIRNNNFLLKPAVATVLAQIVCHNNSLPQGAPTSPVVSNLLAHPLNIRLAALAFRQGCTYSRYSDDLTFSTNKKDFPEKIAQMDRSGMHLWEPGNELSALIGRAGFSINTAKTRMQYRNSRQEVTGLVVNSKVNVRAEYRRTARAMAHRLFSKGVYSFPNGV